MYIILYNIVYNQCSSSCCRKVCYCIKLLLTNPRRIPKIVRILIQLHEIKTIVNEMGSVESFGLLQGLLICSTICKEFWSSYPIMFLSQCTDDNCRKEGHSVQKRVVICKYNNGTVTKAEKCREERPPYQQHCKNPNCTAVWQTSKWSEVSHTLPHM